MSQWAGLERGWLSSLRSVGWEHEWEQSEGKTRLWSSPTSFPLQPALHTQMWSSSEARQVGGKSPVLHTSGLGQGIAGQEDASRGSMEEELRSQSGSVWSEAPSLASPMSPDNSPSMMSPRPVHACLPLPSPQCI